MINVGAVSDFFRTCDAVSVAVHRLSGNQTEQTMRKFYLISLAAAAALSLTGCLKSEGNDLFKKLEPVRPGIAIYNAAHPQNVLSMQSADAALRLAMLLAEAEKQAAAAVEQEQEPGDPFDVDTEKAGLPIDQSREAGSALFSDDGIAFPIPQARSVLSFQGSLFNAVSDLDLSSPLGHAFTVTRFTVVSQVSGHLSAIHKAIKRARIDSSVDCRGADP